MTFSSFMCTKTKEIPPVRFFYQWFYNAGAGAGVFTRRSGSFEIIDQLTLSGEYPGTLFQIIRDTPPNHNNIYTTSNNAYLVLEYINYDPGLVCVNTKTMQRVMGNRYTSSLSILSHLLSPSKTHVYLLTQSATGQALLRYVRLSDLASIAVYNRAWGENETALLAVDSTYIYTVHIYGNPPNGTARIGVARRYVSTLQLYDRIDTSIAGNVTGYCSGVVIGSYLYFPVHGFNGYGSGPGGIIRVNFPSITGITSVQQPQHNLVSWAVDTNGVYAYTVGFHTNTSTLHKFQINTTPMTHLQQVTLPHAPYTPHDIVYDSTNNLIYVIYSTIGHLAIFDTSLQHIQTITSSFLHDFRYVS